MLVQSSYQLCKNLLVLLQSVVTMASLDQIVAETLSPISKVRNNGEYVESASRIKSNQIESNLSQSRVVACHHSTMR